MGDEPCRKATTYTVQHKHSKMQTHFHDSSGIRTEERTKIFRASDSMATSMGIDNSDLYFCFTSWAINHSVFPEIKRILQSLLKWRQIILTTYNRDSSGITIRIICICLSDQDHFN
jgi:hypothetical protein